MKYLTMKLTFILIVLLTSCKSRFILNELNVQNYKFTLQKLNYHNLLCGYSLRVTDSTNYVSKRIKIYEDKVSHLFLGYMVDYNYPLQNPVYYHFVTDTIGDNLLFLGDTVGNSGIVLKSMIKSKTLIGLTDDEMNGLLLINPYLFKDYGEILSNVIGKIELIGRPLGP